MNILIIGQRMVLHKVNSAWGSLVRFGHTVRFLYRGANFDRIWATELDENDFLDQVKTEIDDFNIDIIYAYADRDHEVYRKFINPIFKNIDVIPKVFAFHNHHAVVTDLDKDIYAQSDAHVFLNEDSAHFFAGFIETQRYLCLPSLFLPPRKWFDGIAGVYKKRPERHIAGGGYFLCLDDIRYDYRELSKELSDAGFHVHLHGRFGIAQWPNDRNRQIEEEYNKLSMSSPRIRLEGLYPTLEFETQIAKFDMFLNKGFKPNRPVPPFEQMNYQLRTSSAVKAGLPFLVAEGTDKPMEKLVRETGAGIVFSGMDDLKELLENDDLLFRCRQNVSKLADYLSFEYWQDHIIEFFERVLYDFREK